MGDRHLITRVGPAVEGALEHLRAPHALEGALDGERRLRVRLDRMALER